VKQRGDGVIARERRRFARHHDRYRPALEEERRAGEEQERSNVGPLDAGDHEDDGFDRRRPNGGQRGVDVVQAVRGREPWAACGSRGPQRVEGRLGAPSGIDHHTTRACEGPQGHVELVGRRRLDEQKEGRLVLLRSDPPRLAVPLANRTSEAEPTTSHRLDRVPTRHDRDGS
jgi:hypothetical protein